MNLSMMKRTAWAYAGHAMRWLLFGLRMIAALCLVLILGPLCVAVSLLIVLFWPAIKAFDGWKCRYWREAFQAGYVIGLQHMANPPHLQIGEVADELSPGIKEQIEKIMEDGA